MFGEEYKILYEYPEYFLDYREMLDPTIRWTDRLQSSSGDWSGNVFDFFFRVASKLTKDLKIPFKLEGITRIDDTPVHKALREALANCLINTDFFVPRGVVIKKEIDKIIIENPGYIRTGKDQMLKGGISDPRNKALMKMFNMLGIGERAGSGVPDIYHTWGSQGWLEPKVEEKYNPDRTILTLSFNLKNKDSKEGINDDINEGRNIKIYNILASLSEAKRNKSLLILKEIMQNNRATVKNISDNTGLSTKTVERYLLTLKEVGLIHRDNSNKSQSWKTLINTTDFKKYYSYDEANEANHEANEANHEANEANREANHEANCEANRANREANELNKDHIHQAIITLLFENPRITQIELANQVGVSRATIQRYIKTMIESKTIERIGSTRGSWKILLHSTKK